MSEECSQGTGPTGGPLNLEEVDVQPPFADTGLSGVQL